MIDTRSEIVPQDVERAIAERRAARERLAKMRRAIRDAAYVTATTQSQNDTHEVRISKKDALRLIAESPDGWSLTVWRVTGEVSIDPRDHYSDNAVTVV